MSLSAPEIAAIVVGLAGGYWLVNAVLDGKESGPKRSGPRPQSAREPQEEAPRREAPPPPPPPSSATPPWWEVLGVPRIATREEISRAYKRKISEYHPDKVAQLGDEIRAVAERKSKEINAAYDEALRRF